MPIKHGLFLQLLGSMAGFPFFFGELMSQQYSFFFVLSLLLIVRGACIEFYIKSAKFKWFWLFSLSTSSLLILACHIFLCALLISPSCFSTVPLFVIAASILWFNFTQAYCFLFFLNQYSRLILLLGLFLISTVLMYVLDVSVWQSHLTSLIFLFGVALLISFLTLSIFTCPPRWFSKILLYYLFVINVFFISQKRILDLIMLHYHELTPVTNNTSYLVINAFSMMLLPLIALGLATMKMVFYKNHNEISY